MAYTIKDMNEDLKREVANIKIKKRFVGHKATQVHGEQGKNKTATSRKKRRKDKQMGYRDGGW